MTANWIAIEIGCAACQEDTKVLGVFTDPDVAMEVADKAYDEHGGACSQYNTEVHLLPDPK